MKILMEAHSLLPPRTGIGRYSETLVRGLVNHLKIEEISLLLSIFPLGKNWRSGIRSLREIQAEIPIHRIPLPYGWLQTLWNLLDEPKVDRWLPSVDVVHGPGHVLPRRQHAAGVITVHDASLWEHPEWYPKVSQQFVRQIQTGIDQADRVIVPSESVKKKLNELTSQYNSKVVVIPHEIHTKETSISREGKEEFKRRSLGINFPYLFWNGEINPRKNIPLLFQTLWGLRKLGDKDLRLIMVGSLGFQSRLIMQEAEKLGLILESCPSLRSGSNADIIHYGFVPEETLPSLMAGAKVFLFPSWDEGFGYPVLEAMACGVPVVCSSTGSLPEICLDSACLVDPHAGAEPFIQAVSQLLCDSDMYRRYQDLGWARQQAFRHNGMVERTVQVYQEAILAKQS